MTDHKLAEKLTNYRNKLEKYSKVNDILKIKAYLNELNNIEKISLEILKETQIVESLKCLKKKENPEFSPRAESIIKKWKNIVTRTENEEKKRNLVKHSSEKNTIEHDNSEPQSKKPKLDELESKIQIKQENIFDSLYNVNIFKSETKASTNPSFVPKPTTRLEDIVSIDSISTPNTSFSRNYQKFLYSNQENVNENREDEDDDDALAKILKSRQSQRKLYTGRKFNPNGAPIQVPSLFELSSRCLVENLDDLHLRISSYNLRNPFPVAFDLIKKVLEKANAKQLQNIEYYSPNLLEDTDDLWKKICEQDFKNVRPSEDENWRDLYYRMLDEREEKFRRARDLISKKQAEKPKERQTKEASVKFVSSTARNSSSVLSSSAAVSKLKILNSSAGPVRQIVHDSSNIKSGSSLGVQRRQQIPTAQVMSKGMKATMKLLKKNTSRR